MLSRFYKAGKFLTLLGKTRNLSKFSSKRKKKCALRFLCVCAFFFLVVFFFVLFLFCCFLFFVVLLFFGGGVVCFVLFVCLFVCLFCFVLFCFVLFLFCFWFFARSHSCPPATDGIVGHYQGALNHRLYKNKDNVSVIVPSQDGTVPPRKSIHTRLII